MAQKHFSITNAFEFAFDMLVHHHYIFLQFLIIVGGLCWAGHYVGRTYLRPHVKEAFALIKQRATRALWTHKISSMMQEPLSPQAETIKKWVLKIFNPPFAQVTTIRKETGKAVIEKTTVLLSDKKAIPTAPLMTAPEPRPEDYHRIFWGIICLLISYLMVTFISFLSVRLGIAFYSFHTINISHALHLTMRLLLTTFACFLLYELVVSIGLLLLIIPGIMLFLRYLLFLPLLADERAISVREAFNMSGQCTDGAKWKLLLFVIFCALINSFGMHTGWGYLITAPILTLAFVHVYYQLLEKTPRVLAEGHCEATIGA
jgi:hypothetical protein